MKGTEGYAGVRELPSFGFDNNGFNTPITKLNYTKTNTLENPTAMRQSVLLTNMGGVRGVKPCKGAADAGGVWGVQRVLRRPAIEGEQGMYPSQGYARNQERGLAWSWEKPIDQPLMPLADSFNAGLNSRIPQPA